MIVTSQKIDLLRKLLGTPDVERRGINVQFWCPAKTIIQKSVN